MSPQRKLAFEDAPEKIDYLEMPASGLLEEYGAGRHIPGSGSAAAFSSLIGLEMLRTVCKRTLKKDDYAHVHRRMRFILERVERLRPRLVELFQEDIDCFDRVSQIRAERDACKDRKSRDRHRISALNAQKKATEIPIEICEISLQLLGLANAVFDEGYRAVRGDSGVAISSLLSAVSGGLFVVFLNLKDYRAQRWDKWRNLMRRQADKIFDTLKEYQTVAYIKVLKLQEEGISVIDDQLQLGFIEND